MNCASLRSAAACVALGGVVFACTGTTQALNAPLGDCTATADASCSVDLPPTGSVSGPPDGAVPDAGGVVVEDAEAGTCGLDFILSQTSQRTFPACQSCVFASPCCLGETACANDGACAAILQCVTGDACTDSTCVGSCEALGASGVSDYTELAQCITMNCSSECPFVSTTGDL
jgi:hypothetical protein